MIADPQRAYRFSTDAHWARCLVTRADGNSGQGVRPMRPFATTAHLVASAGARAPAVASNGEVFWHDASGDRLFRLAPNDDVPESVHAPTAIARATRLLATRFGLWTIDAHAGRVQRFDIDALARLDEAVLPGWRAIDIAADAHDKLLVLAERDGVAHALRVGCAGHLVHDDIVFDDLRHARAFIYLRRSKRFVVLAGGEDPELAWFGEQGGRALARVQVATLHRCFVAHALGSDARDRVFVAGANAASTGGAASVVSFDGDATPLGRLPLDPRDAPPTGVAASRQALYVAGPRGVSRFASVDTVPDDAGDVQSQVVTPMLHSPDREDGRRWLRIEAIATLPRGTTLELAYAATSEPVIRQRLVAIANDTTLTAHQRMQRMFAEPGPWRARIVFHGDGSERQRLSAPLFDVGDAHAWASARLIAAPGAPMPVLHELAVLYPGHTLMSYLPSIYRREETVPDSFLRALVGVFEATSQDLDTRIAALGSHVDPRTAPAEWLDALARWFGLPWDDTLDLEHKRCILTQAHDLARTRGTRAGLETFLACLLPGTPRRFRVVDAVADHGVAMLGAGSDCEGSALPALLGGPPRWRAELGAGAVLGRMRLPCDNDDPHGWRIARTVRIDIAATAAERRAWSAWLPAAIDALVPLTARARVRWIALRTWRARQHDDALELQPAPSAHLGDDAITGVARLPARGVRIGATGADTGTRLI
jgi:phage tail-like protein